MVVATLYTETKKETKKSINIRLYIKRRKIMEANVNGKGNNMTVKRLVIELESTDSDEEETKAKGKEETKAQAKEETKAQVKEEPKAQVKEEPKAQAKEEPKTKAKDPKDNDDLSKKIKNWLLIALLVIAIIALLAWLFKTAPLPAASAPATGSSSTSGSGAAASAPVAAPIDSVLEVPDPRSAGSNTNFIGYYGSRGKDWTVPTKVLDTSNQEREVGSALYTWCETRTNCFYQVLQPGETIAVGHQGSQINIYSKEYMGLESNELQYIATEANTNWTAVK